MLPPLQGHTLRAEGLPAAAGPSVSVGGCLRVPALPEPCPPLPAPVTLTAGGKHPLRTHAVPAHPRRARVPADQITRGGG